MTVLTGAKPANGFVRWGSRRGMVLPIFGGSYAIEANVAVPGGGAEGVIVANADFISGFALWVDEQRLLHHAYSFLGVETYTQASTKLSSGGTVPRSRASRQRAGERHVVRDGAPPAEPRCRPRLCLMGPAAETRVRPHIRGDILASLVGTTREQRHGGRAAWAFVGELPQG